MPHALGPDPHPSEKRLDVLDLSPPPSLQSLPHSRLTLFPDDWKADSLDGHHSPQPLKKPHNSFHSRNCRLPRQTITSLVTLNHALLGTVDSLKNTQSKSTPSIAYGLKKYVITYVSYFWNVCTRFTVLPVIFIFSVITYFHTISGVWREDPKLFFWCKKSSYKQKC